jgi:CDP-diacylglycerol---glycerol-3-phosphate 3-phosphatidyltransferase
MRLTSIYQLKGRFQELLRPIVTFFARIGVAPNHVTLAAILLSLCEGAALWFFSCDRWPWLLLPIVLFVRMALNAMDGMLAREYQLQTRLGAVLNEAGDIVSDIFLYLPFVLVAGGFVWLVMSICVLSALSELGGLIGVRTGMGRRYDGPMGKSDRAVVFGALGVLLGLGVQPGLWLTVVFAAVLLLLLATIFYRAAKALNGTRRDA